MGARTDAGTAAQTRSTWLGPLALGVWFGLAAVWPASKLAIGKTEMLWQPLLLLSALALAAARARQIGWAAAAGQAFVLAAVMTLAAWLPWLHATTGADVQPPYPRLYGAYLALYETAWSALVGWLGWQALARREQAGRPDDWSRPLVMAPLLLIARAASIGHWIVPLIGVCIGALLGAIRPWRWLARPSAATWWRLAPWGLCVVAILAVLGSGLRIYHETGFNDYLMDSDDGNTYYDYATELSHDQTRLWTRPPIEANFFTCYPLVMSWWFRIAGPHIPSWLIWQGVASGLLALAVYHLGRRFASPTVGLLAAGLTTLDHVMLHLMGTLNMEVLFIPALYVAIALWVAAGEAPSRWGLAWLAGLMVGVATLMRPTSTFLPGLWLAFLAFERPKRLRAEMVSQGGGLIAGFAVPIIALVIRNALVWGQPWGARQGSLLSWRANYAWVIQGQHPADVGWDLWLRTLAADPSVIWREMVPHWWTQILYLWTHRGFGQMDLLEGLNHYGFFQAALTSVLSAGIAVGIALAWRRRARGLLALLSMPLYFTGLALVWYVINSRYRSPFLPALYLLACIGLRGVIQAIRAGAAQAAPAGGRDPVMEPALEGLAR